MKKIIILFFFYSIIQATQQIPDYLINGNDTISIKPYFNLRPAIKSYSSHWGSYKAIPKKYRPPIVSSTNCWRGYQAIYEIRNDSLFLNKLGTGFRKSYVTLLEEDLATLANSGIHDSIINKLKDIKGREFLTIGLSGVGSYVSKRSSKKSVFLEEKCFSDAIKVRIGKRLYKNYYNKIFKYATKRNTNEIWEYNKDDLIEKQYAEKDFFLYDLSGMIVFDTGSVLKNIFAECHLPVYDTKYYIEIENGIVTQRDTVSRIIHEPNTVDKSHFTNRNIDFWLPNTFNRIEYYDRLHLSKDLQVEKFDSQGHISRFQFLDTTNNSAVIGKLLPKEDGRFSIKFHKLPKEILSKEIKIYSDYTFRNFHSIKIMFDSGNPTDACWTIGSSKLNSSQIAFISLVNGNANVLLAFYFQNGNDFKVEDIIIDFLKNVYVH